MSINERVKTVRKSHHLNQKEFGDKVGLKQSAISSMEQSGGSVNDRNIRLICDTFNVNEDWLRTGEGDMYLENDEAILNQLASQYKLEGERLNLVRNFLALTIEQQEAIVKSISIIAEANKKAMEAANQTTAVPAAPATSSTPLSDQEEAEIAAIREKYRALRAGEPISERAQLHQELDAALDEKKKATTFPSTASSGKPA